MSSIRVQWRAPTVPVDTYEVYRMATLAADPFLIAQVPGSVLFFDDDAGLPANYYRVRALNADSDLIADSGAFQASPNVPIDLPIRVRLDTHFGGVDALRYATAGGGPIAYAKIAVYRKIDYDQGKLNQPLGRTETDREGRWVSPIWVEPGMDYTIQFFKQSEFGPDVTNVTVGISG